jgi:hypothetical protein
MVARFSVHRPGLEYELHATSAYEQIKKLIWLICAANRDLMGLALVVAAMTKA